mgnify:FL=1
MPDQVAEEVKEARRDEIMELQQEIPMIRELTVSDRNFS